ncbi:type II secretion system F family protein [Streptomyces sp. NPDC101132]|uniref:type II secretion system F family protein n=1 Tax=Streptomyces sp. NPDC101132 TaxID=3366110 RepID=UPI0037FD224F
MTGDFVHRLGTVVAVAAVGAWLGCLVRAAVLERGARRRLLGVLGGPGGGGAGGGGLAGAVRGAGVPGGAVRGGPAGAVRGVGVAGGAGEVPGAGRWGRGWVRWAVRWRRRVDRVGAGRREDGRQLPFAADLLGACLAAGAGPREAAEVVGDSLGGPVGERLARAGAELRLGGEPGEAWGRLAAIPGARPLADCLERAARTGAPAAEPVSRLAAGLRAERARAATARAQRAAVLITAPVGLCFLPAFLAVGVAPVVIGLAAGLLGGR